MAGTKVATIDGEVAIETIAVGTLVLAFDEVTGRKEYKKVTRVFENEAEEKTTLVFDSEEKPIECTPGHPFYVLNAEKDRKEVVYQGQERNSTQNGKWISAAELKVGDKCLLSSGRIAILKEISTEKCEKYKTYNLEVEDFHTYYVGNSGILVHNMCGEEWEWGKGTYDSAEKSLTDHARRHGAELGLDPTDVDGYFKKARNFADTIVQRRVRYIREVKGATPNILRYEYLGKYIHMDKYNKIIVSFGIIT